MVPLAAQQCHLPRGIRRLEQRRTGDEHVRAGFDRGSRGVAVDAAVDLDEELEPPRRPRAGERLHLAQRPGDDPLAAEAGIHGHHEHQVHVVEDLGQRLGRRGGNDGDTRPAARAADGRERALRVDRRLQVDGQQIGAAFDEPVDPAVGVLDHQVHVERQRGRPAQVRHRLGAEGEVRHEVPVHDVEVHEIAAHGGDGPGATGQVAEVRGEHRGGDEDSAPHLFILSRAGGCNARRLPSRAAPVDPLEIDAPELTKPPAPV